MQKEKKTGRKGGTLRGREENESILFSFCIYQNFLKNNDIPVACISSMGPMEYFQKYFFFFFKIQNIILFQWYQNEWKTEFFVSEWTLKFKNKKYGNRINFWTFLKSNFQTLYQNYVFYFADDKKKNKIKKIVPQI